MEFQFELQGEALNSNRWAFENGYIEGNFKIVAEGKTYFEDSYMNVVELAQQLGPWHELARHGQLKDFSFSTIDSEDIMLQFTMEENDFVTVHSQFENSELPKVPIEIVKTAVLSYLTRLNEQLHEMNYIQKLDQYLSPVVTENTKAIALYESNDYEEALALFKKLAIETPSIQSLNNYAWILLRDEEELLEAEKWLQKALVFKPKAAFPYVLLGEITLKNEQFERAKQYLEQANQLHMTKEGSNNLAIAYLKLGEFKRAARIFSQIEGDSGITQLDEVVAWMYAGQKQRAKNLLSQWNESSEDYTGAIEIADVYTELECFEEARIQFEKEWNDGINTLYIVSRFAYVLWKLNDLDACQRIVEQAIKETLENIKEVQLEEVEENWTLEDKEEVIMDLKADYKALHSLIQRLNEGYIPPFEFEFYPLEGCQLFGCMRHGHEEYNA